MDTILTNKNTSNKTEKEALKKFANVLTNGPVTAKSLRTAVNNTGLIKPWVSPGSEKELIINPKSFVLTKSDIKSGELTRLRKQTILLLALSLVNEFRSASGITVNGYRSISLKLNTGTENYSPELLSCLCNTVEWINKENPDKKRDLLSEELSLTLDENETFIKGLEKHLSNCLKTAQNRYASFNLSIEGIRVKEIARFITLVKEQSVIYSLKTSAVLNRLFRDTLVATLLVGAIIFTKYPASIIEKINLLDAVFTGLGTYFIISIIYQSIKDIPDILLSKNKLLYWKNTATGLLPGAELTATIEEPLKAIKRSLLIFYPVIIITYLAVSCICYRFLEIF